VFRWYVVLPNSAWPGGLFAGAPESALPLVFFLLRWAFGQLPV
jgi:hypothetical protein